MLNITRPNFMGDQWIYWKVPTGIAEKTFAATRRILVIPAFIGWTLGQYAQSATKRSN